MIRTVGSEIDRLEGELRELAPGLSYVDLETDKGSSGGGSGGSGGGVGGGGVTASSDTDIDLAEVRRMYDSSKPLSEN